jgi:hypothetical protein
MGVSINLWAIVVSILGSVVLGFIWYGPLFGKKWMALNGMVMPEVKPAFSTMLKPIVISFVGALFMSFVLARLIAVGGAYFGISGISNGLATAFMVWLGFIVPVHFNSAGWEGKSWTLFFINSGYWLVYLLLIGMLIAAWV